MTGKTSPILSRRAPRWRSCPSRRCRLRQSERFWVHNCERRVQYRIAGVTVAEDVAKGRPGRPRSEQSRTAVLRATSELMRELGLRAMTADEIANRSGVSKATIYKWWPNKYAVAVEAFLSEMAIQSSDPDTGSAHEDFRRVLRGMIHFYRSKSGRAYAQLVGEAQFDA